MSDCFICVQNQSFRLEGKSKVVASINISSNIVGKLIGTSRIESSKLQRLGLAKVSLVGKSSIRSKVGLKQNIIALSSEPTGKIRAYTKLNGSLKSRVSSTSKLTNKYVDKFAGHLTNISSIKNFASVQKLYPIGDHTTYLNNSYFVDKNLSSGNLYQSIDEGVFTGNYNENFNISRIIADDNSSYIQPSSVFTSGTFRYKCKVSRPYHHPSNSFLFIRASAPISNYGANIPPEYRIHNIKLEDPSGNLIIKYKDITLRGDSDYSSNNINFATYISEPETNNANLRSWDSNYPILGEASGYTLNMDFDIMCLDDPFDIGFDTGYEEKVCAVGFVHTDSDDYLALDGSPLSTQTQGYSLNPTNTIRISAIEICNSGDLCSSCSTSGIKHDNYVGFYTQVNSIGQRLSRTIYPSELILSTYNINVYPEVYSVWESFPTSATNATSSGSNILLNSIQNLSNVDYIRLIHNDPIVDSGRLTLKFSHRPPQLQAGLLGGSFDLGTSTDFDRAKVTAIQEADSFFIVDDIELKVIAKKSIGTRNYVLDVVGYSDDKILNVTPKTGAFLQNTNVGTGVVPLSSGFSVVNDFGLSSEPISDKDQYYEDYLTSITAGDHYKLSTLPVVSGTEFEEYTIPLTIYEDYVDVGKSKDYSMSSYFENLYLDLYNIPSGASIASVRLVVTYRPSNGISLHTFGTPSNKELGRREVSLLPVGRTSSSDILINSDISIEALSSISGIPHGYGEPNTLKTNYSRRWRGVDGNIVNGPYDPNEFDFGFYNQEADHPFLNGYFDLNYIENNFILTNNHPYYYSGSGYAAISGLYNGSSNIIKNIGLRLSTDQLSSKSTPYSTLDWAESGDPLYGRICDAFDSAIKVSGTYGNINFGDLPIASGFALYLRFTPDYNMSGVSYNLYNSGVLVSKWDSGKTLEMMLGFENGYITAFVNDTTSGLIKVQDSQTYDNYQYPLSVLVTYDKRSNGTVRLYCNNETSTSLYLRDEESPVTLNIDSSDLVVGYSSGSGIGSNIFVHEFGISSSGNLVNSNPNRLYKQTTASSFLEGHSHTFLHNTTNNTKFKLHNYIDNNTSLWKLGDFKICSFSPAFDSFTNRIGKDYIVHHLKHHGSGYSQIVDLAIPSSVYASGLSYHTQIENDFLRFNLQDIPNVNPEFYSTLPRICKTLPRGYDFAEKAFVVDTIIEHETNDNIVWNDGSIGPKLIVSLYSKNQNPANRPSKVNWGLINRSIHFIEPSGCYEKISSTFNYNDLVDVSEPWALFDLDLATSEFDQKYYSTDINDMFLQYDLVYPSGSPFDSKIKIHSSTVRLEDALVYWSSSGNSVNLYASGESISRSNINLFNYGHEILSSSGLIIYTSGSAWPSSNGSLNISMSGIYGIPNSQFNLFVKNSGIIAETGPILYVSGGFPRQEQGVNLVMIDNTNDQIRNNSLELFVKNTEPTYSDSSMSLALADTYDIYDYRRNSNVNLVLFNNQVIVGNATNNMSLYITTDLDYSPSSGSFNLFTINYPAYNQNFNQQTVISWNKDNVGKSIDAVIDSGVPFLSANDEIRGVDLLCFGNCDNDNKCKEDIINIHDIPWYEEYSCIEAGIFNVKNTYTNLQVSGFKTNIGYSGHFYGIRKYDGLIPNAPYKITITTKTGNNSSISLPTEFIEVDYGSNSYVNYSGIKFAADKGLDNTERQSGNMYGKSVAAKKDLIAIGAPMQTVSYSEYDSSGNLVTTNLDDAGSVFLYRRNARPSGFSWPDNEHKSDWVLESKLTLPSGILKDYPTIVPRNTIDGTSIPETVYERFWNVGQEGRQFGHSLDIAINDNMQSFKEDKKEIIVIGGPSSKWTRSFEDLSTSGVSIGLLIFTDEFVPSFVDPNDNSKTISYKNVIEAIQNKDLIFRYFSDPPIKFNVKLIICEPKSAITNVVSFNFPEPKPEFIVKTTIPRNSGNPITELNSLAIFSGIKSAFEEAFPYDVTKIHNNIPTMLGVYVDNSRSLGRQAIEPGIDKFLSYYQQYSFASGLTDFFNVPSSGAVYEYDSSSANPEDWVTLSITALNELLDTGRLVANNEVRFLSSGIGPEYFNTNLTQFNHSPPSGGKVYIFEKESGSWNLIQEIGSPVTSYDTIDRFGHAVAISENTEVIAIGSPYINECCKIYQYKPTEKERLFNNLFTWLNYQSSLVGGSSARYIQLIEDYQNWIELYGVTYANEILYSKLTSTEKFQARDYLNIEEYENIFTYKYTDIPYVGTYDFIPRTFAPSSRLGYSVAVNDDGTTVAFGAPTDSFNVFDDFNVYYKNDGYLDPLNIDNINGTIKPSWRSNVNAGAVRLFESRNYYPHNKVVEFGKFGNLQESLIDPLDSGHFNYLATIFQDKNFRKMSENEVSIPQDAGLAFIITPAQDALSEEVLENLIEWLSLGDRNLVIVGNDPVWEASGAYKASNDIVNKILQNLNSKMKLYPARNSYEALSSGNSLVIPSFKPQYGTDTYVQGFNMQTSYGVADIRMNVPGFARYMTCSDNDLNNKCELPLVNGGDLRAQWIESCARSDCGTAVIQYPVNWPFIFKTFSPDCCEVELETINQGRLDLQNQDPVPILVAAEQANVTRTIPGSPARYSYEPIITENTIYTSQTVYAFDQDNKSIVPSFVWNSGTQGYSSYESNINGVDGRYKWFIPEQFENRKGLLQAEAFSVEDLILGSQKVSDYSPYCVEQSFGSSKIIAIAGVQSESQAALLDAIVGDTNLSFYLNMVSKSVNGEANIAQLGGWTGRTSFADAYSGSILYERFILARNSVELDVESPSMAYDVCWIANALDIPSENDVNELKAWLNIGNKKLIITHDSSVEQMLIAEKILSLLGTNIKPLFLPVKSVYQNTSSSSLVINNNHPIAQGFGIYPISSFNVGGISFIPFEINNNITSIAYDILPVYDDKIITDGYLKINSGLDKIVFPAIAGSGYKIFIDSVSETPYENQPIDIYIKNVIQQPRLPYPDNSIVTSATIENYTLSNVGIYKTIYNANKNNIQTTEIDFQVQDGKTNIELYIGSFSPRINTKDYLPKTPRIIGISGVLMPILSSVSQIGTVVRTITGFNQTTIVEAVPETTITENIIRPISHLNDTYCSVECYELDFNNKYIADGPVLVAQEIESVSSFNAGSARSRITLISDSSLVQGRFMSDEFGRMSAETVAFIKSLYPQTAFPLQNAGRQFNSISKIVSPERGSPQKYYALLNNSGLNTNFDSNGSQGLLSDFSDQESRYDPRYVVRPVPWLDTDPEEIKDITRNSEINTFNNSQVTYGATAKFSGVIDGTLYGDIGIDGGIPSIMQDTGSDYLDFDRFPSGYPGDLFGYSVSLHKNKLLVGSPFTGFSDDTINPWSYYIASSGQSGIKLSHNGGAGSAYIFEKTFNGSGVRNTKLPWEFIQKLRPSSINVGQDTANSGASQAYSSLGPNPYTSGQLAELTYTTDQFGYSVSIDSDIIAIGAPGHDFSKYIDYIYNSGSYIRKDFSSEFDIPNRNITDLGQSGIRSSIGSGVCVLNNGAIFTFENKLIDLSNRIQKWTLVEKLVQQGSNTREQSINENDHFGRSVYVHRSNRSDSDYILIGGSEKHDYSSSGTHSTSNAGAAFCHDIMLRQPSPAIVDSGAYIDAKIFGERNTSNEPTIRIITQNGLDSKLLYASGIVYTDQNGAIFLEASGQDTSQYGFIKHRPYVVSVDGLYYYGTENNNNMPLFVSGNVLKSEDINLFITAEAGNVYNNIGLYSSSIVDFGSGIVNFYTDCPVPTEVIDSGFNLFMASGIGLNSDNLNIQIRGY